MMMLSHAANAALLMVALLVALVSAVEGTFITKMVGCEGVVGRELVRLGAGVRGVARAGL